MWVNVLFPVLKSNAVNNGKYDTSNMDNAQGASDNNESDTTDHKLGGLDTKYHKVFRDASVLKCCDHSWGLRG